MAELAAVGLASSIITFIDFSIEFGKLVRDVAHTQGKLPKELEECQREIDTIAKWLKGIKRTLPPIEPANQVVQVGHANAKSYLDDEADTNLNSAVQQCTKTSTDLIVLLGSFCSNIATDPNASTIRKTRIAFSNIKKAGKIVWKGDEIKELLGKLQNDRDIVHAHITSRTDHHVGILLYDQQEIFANVQRINGNFLHAVLKLENMEMQNQHLLTQNHELTAKVDILCEIVSAMQRDRRNRFADIFDYVPPPATIFTALHHARMVVSRILLEPGPSLALRLKRARTGPRKYQLARIPDRPQNSLTVQVIVKNASIGRGTPKLLHLNRDDVQDDYTLTRALHRLRESMETLPALKTTTRVTFVRFHQTEGQLSILNSRSPAQPTSLDAVSGGIPHPHQVIDTLYGEELAESLQRIQNLQSSFAGKLQYPDVEDPEELAPQFERASTFQQYARAVEGQGSQSNITTKTAQFLENQKFVHTHTPLWAELETIKQHSSPQTDPETSPEDEWGIFVERDWSEVSKTFLLLCVIASSSRLLSFVLLHLRLLKSSSSALTFSMFLTVVGGCIGLYIPLANNIHEEVFKIKYRQIFTLQNLLEARFWFLVPFSMTVSIIFAVRIARAIISSHSKLAGASSVAFVLVTFTQLFSPLVDHWIWHFHFLISTSLMATLCLTSKETFANAWGPCVGTLLITALSLLFAVTNKWHTYDRASSEFLGGKGVDDFPWDDYLSDSPPFYELQELAGDGDNNNDDEIDHEFETDSDRDGVDI